jgi:hypothetical protein
MGQMTDNCDVVATSALPATKGYIANDINRGIELTFNGGDTCVIPPEPGMEWNPEMMVQ